MTGAPGTHMRTLYTARVVAAPSDNVAMDGRGELGALNIDQRGSLWVREALANGVPALAQSPSNGDPNTSQPRGVQVTADPLEWRVFAFAGAGGPVTGTKLAVAGGRHVLRSFTINAGTYAANGSLIGFQIESPLGTPLFSINITWQPLPFGYVIYGLTDLNIVGGLNADMVARTTFATNPNDYHIVNFSGYTTI